MKCRVLLLTLALMAAASAVVLAAPRFSSAPQVKRADDGFEVRFAVSEPTDVEVAVLDARGRVVRHLAAGRLGKSPPPPFSAGLTQRLVFDGRDDAGEALNPAGLRIRVSVGLRPRLETCLGDNPAALGSVRGIAVGPGGELFVLHVYGALHPNDNTLFCTVFDRAGRYLRTILPYPAGLPREKTGKLKRLEMPDGRLIPFLYQAETRSLLPGAGELPPGQPVVTSDGRLIFVGHQEWMGATTRYNQAGVKQLVVINSDGSIPPDGPLGTVVTEDCQTGVSLALSPDETTLYATGISTGIGPKKRAHHAVYRFGFQEQSPTVFAGDPEDAGAGKDRLDTPRSVAVDSQGNVYVADRANDRVAMFAPDGTWRGELEVDAPERVAVNRRTGAIYVIGGPLMNRLQKFASLDAAAPAAETTLPHFKHERYTAIMTVDAEAEPPVVWVGTPFHWAGFRVLRIEDRGSAFGHQVRLDRLPGNDRPTAGPVLGMALDRAGKRLLVGRQVVDLTTGEWSDGLMDNEGMKKGSGSFGLDGRFYAQSYPRRLTRFGADLKAEPFGRGETAGPLEGLGGTVRLRGRGVTADARGNVFVLWQKGKEELAAGDARDATNLCLYAPDGTLKNNSLIDSEIRNLASVRLDRQGNVYVAAGVRPADRAVPEDFEGMELGKPWRYGMNTNEMNWYTLLFGSIVKFGPQGGAVRTGSGGVPVEYGLPGERRQTTEIAGAEWIRYGASPVPSWRLRYPDTCLCESIRFDVDGFGRVFFPDAGRFRVGVLDSAGNEIGFFGDYGNCDSAGPASRVPIPEIPLLWPYMICADDGVVYIGDRLNRRVLVVRLRYTATADVALASQAA